MFFGGDMWHWFVWLGIPLILYYLYTSLTATTA